MPTFQISANGHDYGTFRGTSADDALNALARDAGYPDGFRAMCSALEWDHDCSRAAYVVREVADPTAKITYHRDHTVTLWNVYTQSWDRIMRPSDRVLASLDERSRARVIRHCGVES